MAYLGNSPVLSQQEYRNIDNISGSFNGVTTSFPLRVNGVAPVPAPQSSNQCLISVNGVVQKPDDSGASGFRISGGNIIFSAAPTGGQSFFGVILAGADYIYAGENFPDGTVTAPSITFKQDLGTGFYRNGAGEVRFTSSGTNAAILNSSSLTAPSFIPTSSTAPTNGVYLSAANTVAISTGGSGRLFVDSSGNINLGQATSALQSGGTGLTIYGATSSEVKFLNSTAGTASTDGTALVSNGNNFLINNREAGYITFGTSNTERLRITDAGLVGIGTSSPDTNSRLHVSASENTSDPFATDASVAISNYQAAGNNEAASLKFLLGTAPGTNAGSISCHYDSFSAGVNSSLRFYTVYQSGFNSPAERMRIDPQGRVGIGSNSPQSLLHLETDGTALRIVRGSSIGFAYNTGTSATSPFRIQSNGGSVDLYSAAGQPITFSAGGTEKAQVDGSGRLLVGTSTTNGGSDAFIQVRGNSSGSNFEGKINLSTGTATNSIVNDTTLGSIQFGNNSTIASAALIECKGDAQWGTNDYPTKLVFSTTLDSASSPTERMRIRNNGTIWIATGGNPPSSTVTGLEFHNTGYIYAVTSGAAVGYFNRNTSDGTLLEFRRDDAAVGTISVSGGTVSYNPFLGSHWGRLPDNQKTDILVGTILETVDQLIEWKVAVFEVEGENKMAAYNGSAAVGETVEIEYEGETYEALIQYEEDPTSDLNKHVCVKVNDTAGSKAVFGVFLGWDNDPSKGVIGTWNDMYCAAVGNYFVRMAASQEPEIGDLVEADGTGCGVVQDDDIIRTKTVAKITSTIPQVTYDDGSFLVTCVLCCG